jgi:hypothetical protein
MFFNDEEETAEGSEAETTEVPTEGAEEVHTEEAPVADEAQAEM